MLVGFGSVMLLVIASVDAVEFSLDEPRLQRLVTVH